MGAPQATLIALGEMHAAASYPKHARSDIMTTVESLMALGRNRRAVAWMGSGPCNKTMQKLRHPKLPKTDPSRPGYLT